MRGGGGKWSRREGVDRKGGEWRGGMEKMFWGEGWKGGKLKWEKGRRGIGGRQG